MDADTVERSVLERIVPTKDVVLSINDRAARLKSIVENYLQEHGIAIDMMFTGSYSKGTFLADPDLDLFLLFPESVPKKEMERIGLRAGEDILHGERIFSEHPYTRGYFEGIEVDLVPCYNLASTADLKTAVDRTPFHTSYITRKLDLPARDQVRLLKRFMKGIGAYGAEQDSRGFSGYLCELLVVKYGSFRKVLEAAASEWRTGTVITIEGAGDRIRSPLVVYDPVDPRRNVASAVHKDTLALFIWASRCYLAEPSEDFFFPPERKPMTYAELKAAAEMHGTRIIIVKFDRPDVLEDVLASQLWKTQYAMERKLDEFEFNAIRAVHSMDDKEMTVALEMERDKVSKTHKHRGPPVWVADASLNFLDHWNGAAYGEPFIDDGLWVVTVDRMYTDAAQMLVNESSNAGIGRDMDPATIRVMRHEDALESGDRAILTDLLRPMFPWEHRGFRRVYNGVPP